MFGMESFHDKLLFMNNGILSVCSIQMHGSPRRYSQLLFLLMAIYTAKLDHCLLCPIVTIRVIIFKTGTFKEEEKEDPPVFGLVVERVNHWNPLWTQVTGSLKFSKIKVSTLLVRWPL